MISSARHARGGGFIVLLTNGTMLRVPDHPANAQRQELNRWVAAGNAIAPADPAPPPPSAGDQFDDLNAGEDRNTWVLRELIKGLNDGSFIVGGNLTPAQLKAWFVARR